MSQENDASKPQSDEDSELEIKQLLWWLGYVAAPQNFVTYSFLAFAYWLGTERFGVVPHSSEYFMWLFPSILIGGLLAKLMFKIWPLPKFPSKHDYVPASEDKSSLQKTKHLLSTVSAQEANSLIQLGWTLLFIQPAVQDEALAEFHLGWQRDDEPQSPGVTLLGHLTGVESKNP